MKTPGIRVRAQRGDSSWKVRASTMDALRVVAIDSVGATSLTHLDLEVSMWAPPKPGWMGHLGIAGVTELRFESRGTGVRVEIALQVPTDAGIVLSACVRLLEPASSGSPHSRITWTPGIRCHGMLAANIENVLTDNADVDVHVRRADVLLISSGSPFRADESTEVGADRVVVIDGDSWSGNQVYVDPSVHRPVGRRPDSVGRVVPASSLALPAWLNSSDVRALRDISAVTGATALSPAVHAQLQAVGVVVLDEESDAPARDDHLGWQVASVRARRDALRQFSPQSALGNWPTVSVIVATHRPDRLLHALSMVTRQTYPHLQLILAMHGDESLTPDALALLENWGGKWSAIAVSSERNLGQVLQEATARADGDLITKMDDDDYYAPEHVWDLVLARMYSGAQVVGKALDYIFLEGEDVTVFRPTYRAEKYADFVAGGTIMISQGDLADVGGWRPIPKSVDRALLDRVLDHGGLVYRTHGVGYVYVRHSTTSNTSRVRDEHFLTKTTATHKGLLSHEELGTPSSAHTRADDHS